VAGEWADEGGNVCESTCVWSDREGWVGIGVFDRLVFAGALHARVARRVACARRHLSFCPHLSFCLHLCFWGLPHSRSLV